MKLYNDLASWWQLMSPAAEYAEEAAFYRTTLCNAAQQPIETILELGSGGGNNASHMKRHFKEMVLVDISPGMLAMSRFEARPPAPSGRHYADRAPWARVRCGLCARCRVYGVPTGWDPRREPVDEYFSRVGAQLFQLHCSYGMHGSIAAERMEQIVLQAPRNAGSE